MRIDRIRVASPWLALVLVLGLGSSALAQTGAASITGLVTDQSGAAAPGVTVSATNQATNVAYSGVSNEAGNYTITSLPVGTYVVRSALSGFKTVSTKPIGAGGQADRPPRLQDGSRPARGHGRGDGARARAADGVGHRGRGHLGEHRAVAPLERAQRRPARAPAPGNRHLQPARLHQHRQREHEPAVREREPRADEQLHRRRPRRQRDDRQPRGLPAQSRRPGRDQRRDQQLRRRRRQRGGRPHQQRGQVRGQPVPRERLRVLPEQRPRRQHLGEQPLRRPPPGAQAAHLRGHPGRSHRQGQVLLLRRLPGLAPGRPGRRDGVGGAGGVAARRPLEHHHPHPRSPHGAAFPGQPDPARPDQPDRARDPERHRELPAAEPHGAGGDQRQLRGRDPVRDPRPSGRPAPRLERLPERQALRPLLLRHLRGPA